MLSSPTCLVPYMLSCLTCYLPYVLSCPSALCTTCFGTSRALGALVSQVSCVLRVLVPNMPRALGALVSYVPRTLHASCLPCCRIPRVSYLGYFFVLCLVSHVPRVSRALCSMCPPALWALLSHVPLVPCNLRTLCANTTFCTLEFPCLTFLFFCSLLACEQIQFADNTLKWLSALIILAQLKVHLKLNLIITKSHSRTVLMKKQQNFQIHLELKRQR